jgi:hypothetical protein
MYVYFNGKEKYFKFSMSQIDVEDCIYHEENTKSFINKWRLATLEQIDLKNE